MDAKRDDAATPSQEERDRLGELLNIGAGHAAGALSDLSGTAVWMQVPRVLAADAPPPACESGVFCDLHGCLGGLIAVLFRSHEHRAVLRRLRHQPFARIVGRDPEASLSELGNILLSHAASAIADTLRGRLLPSPPALAAASAGAELLRRIRGLGAGHPVRVECELTDGRGEVGGLLVLVPHRPSAGARPRPHAPPSS
jgi:chemotaxis protein CheC